MSQRSSWNLNKIVVLLLAGTFLGLTFDLRYEHVDRVHRVWEAWIPIVYSGVMAIACAIFLLRWEQRGRQVLFWAFSLSLIVGTVGFWLHNGRHLFQNLDTTLAAWTRAEHHADKPPTLAPILFCLLGTLGMLACAARTQCGSNPQRR